MATIMYPCNLNKPEAPALFTYYAVMSLLVVVLAISLMWVPFVQLISELNTIIAKAVRHTFERGTTLGESSGKKYKKLGFVVFELIYTNKELLGDYKMCWLNALGAFFTSQQALVIISMIGLFYMLYLASGDFLIFAGSYVCNWPNHKRLQRIKRTMLDIIEYLLNLTGRKRFVSFNGNVKVKFYDPSSEPHKSDANINDQLK